LEACLPQFEMEENNENHFEFEQLQFFYETFEEYMLLKYRFLRNYMDYKQY